MQDAPLSQFPKINLHIHSRFSDGANSVDMIVERALELQFDYIAFTDHFSNSWKASVIKTLDTYKKINIYLKTLKEQNVRLRNQNAQLTVLKGIEIDLGSKFDFITRLINPSRFDLILLEYLNSPETLEFARKVLKYWKEKSNDLGKSIPILGLAHFDPSYFIYDDLDLLFDFLKEYSIYYEFNSAYSHYYATKYREVFEKIKTYGIPVGIGADAHQLDGLNYITDPLEKIIYYGLIKNFQSLTKTLDSL